MRAQGRGQTSRSLGQGKGEGPVIQNHEETEPAREGLRCQSRPGESQKTPYNERPRSMTLDF